MILVHEWDLARLTHLSLKSGIFKRSNWPQWSWPLLWSEVLLIILTIWDFSLSSLYFAYLFLSLTFSIFFLFSGWDHTCFHLFGLTQLNLRIFFSNFFRYIAFLVFLVWLLRLRVGVIVIGYWLIKVTALWAVAIGFLVDYISIHHVTRHVATTLPCSSHCISVLQLLSTCCETIQSHWTWFLLW